jgi:hypothetical protein
LSAEKPPKLKTPLFLSIVFLVSQLFFALLDFIPLIFGSKALSIIPYALPYVSAISLFTLGSIIVTYHLAKKEYLFPVLSVSMSILLTIGMLIFNENLTQIVYVLLTVGFVHISGLTIAHIYKDHLTPRKITLSAAEQNLEKVI